MWITGDVELPDEILDAHERGELVFFVGAGASLDAPSELPLFDGLARELARLASHPFSESGGLDYFVGQLESLPQGFDAHYHAHILISDPKSRFNQLHDSIVDLASSGGAFRVVTTNYDDHLTSASNDKSTTIPDTWYAPALPIGRDFAGLVHLHGSVRRPKEEMILTDRDFGRAYITDAWAARFLLTMFERFTVVFIGYSHDDVIMRYLALGLPSTGEPIDTRRFAFTSDPADSKWSHLGIRPIAYPVSGRDHRALGAALSAWARRAKMGQTDHQSRMQEIIGGGTALPLPDRDYLQARLRNQNGALDFASATGSLPDVDKLEWLHWLEEIPEFKALFLSADVSDATAILGNWFVKTFIESTTLNGAALQTMQRLGQSMTTSLFRTATIAASDLSRRDAAAGIRWQALLASSIFGQSCPIGSDHFTSFVFDEMAPSMTVLRVALRPFLKLGRRWFVDESVEHLAHPDAKIVWNWADYDQAQLILLAVQAHEPGDHSLGGVLEDAIVAAYDLLDDYHGERRWDPLSQHRSAIEPHSQDELREPLDAIIDGLREYGVKALIAWPDLPDHWWLLDRALMQRLALHLVAADQDRSADEKLTWLLDRTGFYTDNLKHEIFQLLADAVVDASPSLKARVLEAAEADPIVLEQTSDLERHTAYAKFNLLAWLTQADPDWTEARTEFEAIQANNPSFEIREHPEFDSWMETGTWDVKPPIDIEDFIQALEQDVKAGLNDLLSYDYSEHHFDQPEWRDAIGLVQQAAERRPDLGVMLWDALIGREDLEQEQSDLCRAIGLGWAKSVLEDVGSEVIERLSSLLPDEDSAHAIGRFLLEQIRKRIEEKESPMLESMRELAHALWRYQGRGFTNNWNSQPLSLAPLYLNSWPGFLAQYWNIEVDRRWRHSREEWSGLSDEERDALVALLRGNDDAIDATQPAIAGELFFYFAADADFTVVHLLPLFNDRQRHAFGWIPFLYHPRWNDRILDAGLFDSLVGEFSRLSELPEKSLQRVFLAFTVSVVSYAGITDADRNRLLDETVLASDGSHAESFAKTVVGFLDEAGTDGAEVWRRWLRPHLERRLSGQPRIASNDELAHWADVVPFVGEYVAAAARLFDSREIGFPDQSFNYELPEGVLAAYGPELVNHYTQRVRNTTVWDYGKRRRVGKIVDAVKTEVDDSVARPLLAAAIQAKLVGYAE